MKTHTLQRLRPEATREEKLFLPEFEVRMMKIASADGLEYTQPTSSNKETCHD